MLNTFLFSAVHLGMQLNTGQDEVEVAHYKPAEEAGDKLIMETGHLSDLLRGKLCPILTPSPILHPAGPYLLAVQVFLPSTKHTKILLTTQIDPQRKHCWTVPSGELGVSPIPNFFLVFWRASL